MAGVTRVFLTPRQAVVTRRLNAECVVELTMDSGEADEYSTNRLVRGMRTPRGGGDRLLRACGKVTAVTGSAAVDKLEQVSVVSAADGFGALRSRTLQDAVTFVAQAPRAIVDAVVETQNARAETGLRVAAGTAGPLRDRTYETGKNAAEIVTQLAEVDDGFWFRVDPVDGEEEFSELVLLHPASGVETGVTFGYGTGTAGTLSGAEVNTTPPVNHVLAFGAGDGDAQLRLSVSDPESIATYGLMDATITHPDVTDAATLEQHARDALRPAEQRTFRVVASSLQDGCPRPWDDFDVGDVVGLNIRGTSPALTYAGDARVVSFTVTVDVDGVERMTNLDLEGV